MRVLSRMTCVCHATQSASLDSGLPASELSVVREGCDPEALLPSAASRSRFRSADLCHVRIDRSALEHQLYPYTPHEIRLNETVPCGPCAVRVCPLQHHRCMQDLRVDRVFDAVQSLLQSLRDAKAA